MQNALTVMCAFLAIALPMYVFGWLLTSWGRREDAFGKNRHLALGILTIPCASIIPAGKERLIKLRRTMLQAGHYHRKAAEEFLGLRNAALVATVALSAVWLSFNSQRSVSIAPQLLFCCSLFVVLFTVPSIVLQSLAKKRTQRIQEALPDAVDMINMLIAGGSPLHGAIDRTSRELESIHKDLAMEFAVLNHQATTGSMEIALRQFASRIDQPEVISLSTIARHAERLGGSVAASFQDYADSIRRQRRQRAEERGNKATVKLMFPVIFCLAPSIYLLLLGPAALEIRDFMRRETQEGGVLVQDTTPTNLRNALDNATSQ